MTRTAAWSLPRRMPDDDRLIVVLESLRDRGALGELSLPRAVEHAEAFVSALPAACGRLIDLGSGGGLPGLVIAMRLPDLDVVLTERRERRADLLRLACAQLGVTERVTVVTADVVSLADRTEYRGAFDAATARAFGDPMWTLACAAPLLRSGGVAVVSEPPPATAGAQPVDRWPVDQVQLRGFSRARSPSATVAVFERC